MQWNVGDECYSQFIEDGEWYAAQIESIDVSQNTCVVKYKYYGNKEEQNLSSLHRYHFKLLFSNLSCFVSFS